MIKKTVKIYSVDELYEAELKDGEWGAKTRLAKKIGVPQQNIDRYLGKNINAINLDGRYIRYKS